MSAILASKQCLECKVSFWISFGHPPWFETRSGPIWGAFMAVARTKKCPVCAFDEWFLLSCLLSNVRPDLIIHATYCCPQCNVTGQVTIPYKEAARKRLDVSDLGEDEMDAIIKAYFSQSHQETSPHCPATEMELTDLTDQDGKEIL